MEERNEVLTLVDEEGKEHLFSIVDLIVVEEKEYAILLPFEKVEEPDGGAADEAVIFRVLQDEQGQVLMVVEDDQEWENVATAWEERGSDEEEDMDVEEMDIED
ncbi:DUF1292 domain-containing protein [Candidatus Contubernalis alkaliaceticus]|uniref:DUF1292 domain-containing protein n=1 Tax=Candidatus Contubernalis alkaliaceticus TaxID=338645 RepID=UPI001F4C1CF2|nr:DUF1292 domain-containing protein [Candidatus Contubernalis alkalaceticus]UNC92588.1 DUF1292 domain-containing protein [Candidatus Contubernalis alkalaceticus]